MNTQQVMPAPEFATSQNATARAAANGVSRQATRPWFKMKRVILPLALLVLTVVIQAANVGLGGLFTTTKTAPEPQLTNDVAPDIGTMVRDGKFEFVVTGVEHPGKTLVGKVGVTLTAKGEFVIVRVNVTNIGDVPRTPNCSCQVLLNEAGKKFEPSPSILSTKEALRFVQRISPGDTVNGVLMLFDVPRGTKVANIELHDSQLSAGVKVKLT